MSGTRRGFAIITFVMYAADSEVESFLTQERFFEGIAEILEVDAASLSAETRFRDVTDTWSSMTGFAMIIFLEDSFGVSLDPDHFTSLDTLGELYSLALPDAPLKASGVK